MAPLSLPCAAWHGLRASAGGSSPRLHKFALMSARGMHRCEGKMRPGPASSGRRGMHFTKVMIM